MGDWLCRVVPIVSTYCMLPTQDQQSGTHHAILPTHCPCFNARSSYFLNADRYPLHNDCTRKGGGARKSRLWLSRRVLLSSSTLTKAPRAFGPHCFNITSMFHQVSGFSILLLSPTSSSFIRILSKRVYILRHIAIIFANEQAYIKAWSERVEAIMVPSMIQSHTLNFCHSL